MEVNKYNRKLNNIINCLNKVTLVKSVTEGEFFTKHGFHLNLRGKEIMANKLVVAIQEITELQVNRDVIPMWDTSIECESNGHKRQERSVSNIVPPSSSANPQWRKKRRNYKN
jgi:hypothetical protein